MWVSWLNGPGFESRGCQSGCQNQFSPFWRKKRKKLQQKKFEKSDFSVQPIFFSSYFVSSNISVFFKTSFFVFLLFSSASNLKLVSLLLLKNVIRLIFFTSLASGKILLLQLFLDVMTSLSLGAVTCSHTSRWQNSEIDFIRLTFFRKIRPLLPLPLFWSSFSFCCFITHTLFWTPRSCCCRFNTAMLVMLLLLLLLPAGSDACMPSCCCPSFPSYLWRCILEGIRLIPPVSRTRQGDLVSRHLSRQLPGRGE